MKKLHTSLALAALAATALSHANAAATDTPVVESTGTDTSGLTVTPVAKPAAAPKAPSKAEISRGIMTKFYKDNQELPESDRKSDADVYEATIAEMQRVNGYDRQLARGTYKANFTKAGVPAPVEGKRPTKKADAAPATTDTSAAPATDSAAPATDSAAPATDSAAPV